MRKAEPTKQAKENRANLTWSLGFSRMSRANPIETRRAKTLKIKKWLVI